MLVRRKVIYTGWVKSHFTSDFIFECRLLTVGKISVVTAYKENKNINNKQSEFLLTLYYTRVVQKKHYVLTLT